MKYLILLLLLACSCNAQQFPDDFFFGVATASYQVEGAWNADGKGENIWDRIIHSNSSFIDGGDSGDVACSTYYNTETDVQLLVDLGVSSYRFSISWARILPTGHANQINQAGIDYYSNLIDQLLANNIQPVVTIYHWDLPQALQEIGGWPNPRLADYYVDYATVLFDNFGSRVPYWITFNEPFQFCTGGYSTMEQAPGYTQDGVGGYLCSYTVLLAHARTYRLYKDSYPTLTGQMGITIDGGWFQPRDPNSESDMLAAESKLQHAFGWFANPIYSAEGDYPQLMKDNVQEISDAIGYSTNRLPVFTDEEIELIRGTADFFGLNHYTTMECTALPELPTSLSQEGDTKANCVFPDEWPGAASSWLKIAPWGFGNLLRWIRDNYGEDLPIMITENGWSDSTGQLIDCDRGYYFNLYLEELLDAIEDGVNVIGYQAWSFMDNFEWRRGYTERFGIYQVDFDDDARTRRIKMSANIYRNIIQTRQIDWSFVPDGYDACPWTNRVFPLDFRFGVATASYQIEGAWDEDGKGENIWDYLSHNNPEAINNSANGDVACDAYHKTSEDVDLLNTMGVDFYRFSLSWSRILPFGHDYFVNEAGIAYYNDLIDQLLAKGITPVVTIYHWDLPQPMHELGGWPNGLMADYYADFANLVFERFGDRVKDWITFNEPYQICQLGYGDATMAPLYEQDGIGSYLCAHTLLLAHARAYEIYDQNYRETQQGRIGITINAMWKEPESDSEEDATAAENAMQFVFGWYANPIFSTDGDYPAVMRERIDEISESEGFVASRLPEFTADEIELLRGSSDFFGLNYYTTEICRELNLETDEVASPSITRDSGAFCYADETLEGGASVWLKVEPTGLRKTLNWIREAYNNVEVFITENGFSDSDGTLQDCRRINYYNVYLEQLLMAINEDGCNVSGYTAWSFMDNFEWLRGYTEKFGLNYVDFDSEDRTRTPKMSLYIYKYIMNYRRIDWDYVPAGFDACDWEDNEV